MTDLAEAPAPTVDPLAPDPSAPYGYLIDEKTGVRRPKKRAGRPKLPPEPAGPPVVFRGSPSIEDLKAAGFGSAAGEDREPGRDPRAKAPRGKEPPAELPPFRAGPIAKGVNRLYRKAGKIVRVFDPDLGAAVIECTRKGMTVDDDGTERIDEDDLTVGEAWEELARTNPRIRRFLLGCLSGGAKMQLFMAHAPILLAIMLKESVSRRIPFGSLIASWMADDEDTPAGGEMGGMTAEDMGQMMAAAQAMAAQMAAGGAFQMPRANGTARMPAGQDYPG